jgi:hypothetical protein
VLLLVAGVLAVLAVALATESLRFPPWPDAAQLLAAPADWSAWFSRLQFVFAPFTLLVALFVWFSEIRENWEAQLPKLLSVYFFRGNVPVLICRYAYLSSESDIRQTGQSVGQQMNDSQRLEFVPFIDQQTSQFLAAASGELFKHYRIRFRLTATPAWSRASGSSDPEAVARARLWQAQGEQGFNEVVPDRLLQEPDVRAWLKNKSG